VSKNCVRPWPLAKSSRITPTDKYGPSCLVFGVTLTHRPLHIQCSYPSRPLVKIITVYEPDPQRWVDFKVRRPIDEQ
jgi:hypothetical protein